MDNEISDYKPDFYDLYRDYLNEPRVREAHDSMFALVRFDAEYREAFETILDLGCGTRELPKYSLPDINARNYLGIDVNVIPGMFPNRIIQANYRDVERIVEILKQREFTPTAFISLFSSEITKSYQENYSLYEKLFKAIPTLKAGMVSGFYYESKKGENPIGETGGIQSYQTLEAPEDVISETFAEKRIVMPVPSNMFGQDVFEVWKILTRR